MPEAAKQCTTVEEELLRLLLLLPFSLALLLFSAIFVRMLPRHQVNLVQLLIITAAVKYLHSYSERPADSGGGLLFFGCQFQ